MKWGIPYMFPGFKIIIEGKNRINSYPNMGDVIYKSLDDIKKFLNREKYKNMSSVSELLDIYDLAAQQKDTCSTSETEKLPMIVLEGLDGCGKSTTTKKLSNKINAHLYSTPPKSIGHLRQLFNSYEAPLRAAYYSLGNYIAALEMSVLLQDQPVVCDRYWHSTAAFALAQDAYDKEKSLPHSESDIYEWPIDLLKPDIVLYLEVSESIRLQRLSRRTESNAQEDLLKNSSAFRDSVEDAYNRMRNPSILYIDCNHYPNKVVKSIKEKLNHLL